MKINRIDNQNFCASKKAILRNPVYFKYATSYGNDITLSEIEKKIKRNPLDIVELRLRMKNYIAVRQDRKGNLSIKNMRIFE